MRQVISDFIYRLHTANQSEQTVTISMREESDKIVRIFSDERYSIGDLAAILEDDITILLRELKSESVAIERDKGNEYWESVHNGKIFMISGIMAVLIDRAAGVRVFLSDDFLLQHEDDIFLNTRFANYVRNEYKAKGKPQQKHIEAPQQPIGGNSGELAGNGNENAPEGSDNGSKYIELPLSMQTDDKRAEKVFTEAVNKGWLQVIDNQHGKWIGFAKTKDGKIKNYEQSLAWLIVEIYDPERKGIVNWSKFEEYFNISDLSKHWGNAITYYNKTEIKRDWQSVIDKLIKAALQ